MKILVVAPQYRPRGTFYELPLGLAYISGYLKNKGLDVKFINLNEEDITTGDVQEADVLCTGGLSAHYNAVRLLLREVKSVKPSIITIVGGGMLSSMPEKMYEMLYPNIDYGVIGEGEKKTFDIIQAIDYMDADMRIPKILTAEVIEDIDSLPWPDYEGLRVRDYLDRQLPGDEHYLYPLDKPRCLPIISSRGCPFNCSFCFHPTGKVYRQRSLDGFFKEVEFLVEEYQVNMLAVLDELIAQDPKRIALFCQRIKKYNLKWMTQMRVDSVDKATILMLKDAGCFQISYGIEHVNDGILKSYNKHTTLAQIEAALAMTYEAGIGIQGNILIGGPNETEATLAEAVAWRDKNLKYMINLTAVIPYPGTDLFSEGVSRGLIDPKSYVESGCGFVNFSGVALRLPQALLYGKMISDYTVRHDEERGDIKKIKAECPHCGAVVEYNGLYWGGTGIAFTGGRSYRIACRVCNQRFDIK